MFFFIQINYAIIYTGLVITCASGNLSVGNEQEYEHPPCV